MLARRLLLTAAINFAVVAMPYAARAQSIGGNGLGGPSMGGGGGPPSQQSMMGSGEADVRQHTDKDTTATIIKDVKHGLKDADPNTRVTELKKLRDLEDPEVNKILIGAVDDPDLRVKIKAVDLLGARQANEAVLALSQNLFLRSTAPLVRLHVTAALGRIGDARGALPVMQYLQEEREHPSQSDDRVRGTAVFALGEIGNDQANDILSQVASSDSSEMVRRLAQEALEKIDGELPSQHATLMAAQKAKYMLPTDQRLSKLRAYDEKLQSMDR